MSSNELDKNYAAILNTILPGQQIRTNHLYCPAGEDSRRRLYITRLESKGRVCLGYCHNCGNSYYSKSEYQYYYRANKGSTHPDEDKKELKKRINLMAHEYHTEGITIFDLKARDLLDSAASWAKAEYLRRADVKYMENYHRFFIPIYSNTTSSLVGWQTRSPFPDQVPKYILYKPEVQAPFQPYFPPGWTSDTPVVITEDQISAAAVTLAGYVGVCMFGTNSSLPLIHSLHEWAKSSRYWVVWFDNDNYIVREHANTVKETLTLLGAYHVAHVKDTQEPKHKSVDEIKRSISFAPA